MTDQDQKITSTALPAENKPLTADDIEAQANLLKEEATYLINTHILKLEPNAESALGKRLAECLIGSSLLQVTAMMARISEAPRQD